MVMALTRERPRRGMVEDLEDRVEEAVRERLSTGCPYAFYFSKVECDYDDGILTLRGRVPTFYLKQILQSRLIDIAGVSGIDNQVDVVSSTGLSSV